MASPARILARTPNDDEEANPPLPSAKRVLIYRLGSLGDTIVALPCLHLVARMFPESERALLTNIPVNASAPAAAAVLGSQALGDTVRGGPNLIHKYFNYPASTRNVLTLARIAFSLRQWSPDVLIYLAAPRGEAALQRDARFFRSCGIRTIYGLPTGDLATNQLDPRTGFFESEAHRLARTLRPLGDARLDDAASWDLQLTREELAFGEETAATFAGHPYIVCAPGCKAQANDWEDHNWATFFDQLSTRLPGLGLVLTGAPSDYERNQFLARSWKGIAQPSSRLSSQFTTQLANQHLARSETISPLIGNVLNIAGATTPRQVAALLVRAAMYVGPDSGPMHIAAAVGTPCVSIFSARNAPGIWFPYARANAKPHYPIYHGVDCSPCGLETCIEQKKKCILSIQPSEVFTAALRILEPLFHSQTIA